MPARRPVMRKRFPSVSVPAPGAVIAVTIRVLALFLFLAPVATTARAAEESCTGCHEQGQKVAKSAHNSLSCGTCHVKHEEYPHPPKIAKPVCTECHTQQGSDYEQSAHGQAAKKGGAAPDCALCHGSAHELISPKVATFRTSVIDTCSMCHT